METSSIGVIFMANLTDKKFNKINNFLNTYIDPQAAKLFKAAHKNGKDIEWLKQNWELLEEYEPWTRTYNSIDDLTVSPEKQKEQIYNANPDFSKISKARLKTILDEGDFTEEQLKNYYDLRKAQTKLNDEFNQERYKEIETNRKEAERAKDNSYYTGSIANEYAKKHYIKGHPNQAIVNEIAGKIAAGADFLPFPYSLGGPAIRSTQKWAADEPVLNAHTALDWGAGSLGFLGKIPGVKDFARTTTSKLADILLKGKGKNTQEIKSVVNAKLLKEQQERAARELDNIARSLDDMSDRSLIELEATTDNPILKANIKSLRKAKGEHQAAEIARGNPKVANNDVAASKAADVAASKAAEYDKALHKTIIDAAEQQPTLEVKANRVKGNQVYGYEGDPDALQPYFRNVPGEDIVRYEQANMDPKWYNTLIGKSILAAERKAVNNSVAGRRWNEIDYKPNYNEDKAINEVINMYRNDWLRNGKPANYDDPLIKAAYDKWVTEQLRKGSYNDLQRMGVVK